MALPILNLPFLVFQLVLESMGFIELFLLTRLSDKMKRIVKSRVKVRNYKMKVYFEDTFTLSLFNENHEEMFVLDVLEKHKPEDDECFPLKLGNADGILSGFFFSETCEDLLITFWNDLMAGHREFISEVMAMFPSPIEFVIIEQHYDIEAIVQWASALTIEKVQLTGENFELHHLQALNVPSITLYDSSLSDQDIHNFLHDMSIGMSNTNLKEMSILFDRDDSNSAFITRGLNVTEEDDERDVPEYSSLVVYHLTLSNGETGTIKYVFTTVENSNHPDHEYWGYDVEIVRREVNHQ